MPFPEFDPILVQLGPFAIRWYALAYVAGILIGWRYAVGLLRNTALWTHRPAPLTPEQMDDLILWIAIGVIGGGRLGHVIFYTPGLIASDPLGVFRVWEGGMSFHGGVIGVSIAMIIYAWRNKADLLRIADVVSCAYPIGHFLGRCANFINGELWGRETTVPWAIRFCNQRIVDTYGFCPAGDVPRHPSQLYEAGLEGLVLFVVLWLAIWKLKLLTKPGFVTGLFLFGYGLSRALMEMVREPDSHMPEALRGVITMGMLLSIPMILIGAWLIWRARNRPPVGSAPAA